MACATHLFKQVCLTLWDGVCCVVSGPTVLPTTSLSCCGLLSDYQHRVSTVLPHHLHSSQHLYISYIPVCPSIPLCSTLSSSAIACSDTSDDGDGGVSSDDSGPLLMTVRMVAALPSPHQVSSGCTLVLGGIPV